MDAVHVVGAGGIGCAVGYALRAAGAAVTFVDANPAKVAAGRRDGVRVDARPPLAAAFVPVAEWRPPPAATVLLCVKCYDNAAVLARLPADVRLIPIQNGFDPRLAAHGHEWEGIASFVSECAADRPHTRITRPGALHVGRRTLRRDAESAERSANHFRAPLRGLRVAAKRDRLFRLVGVPDIGPVKHAKLMYNAAISPLAAAAGIDNGRLLSVPAARRLFFALLQENHRILTAAGTPLGKVGPFHPDTVAWILRRKWLAGLMAKAFEPSLRGTYCSMAGEIEKGRTELDNYTGHLLRLADRTGTPAPLNRAVYDLVAGMTARREAPGPHVFDQLASAASTASYRGPVAVSSNRRRFSSRT